ncbi:hypothetical protein CEUSTIGMA_g4483.t1 [Chlamydomonas eustigma]|uniref:Sulfotransferase n=1 Tax=Chlamydomonas eustigma TaxID=1157962 RepID=A0A250X1V8_9CHLO|nr:hypothetical protein CEUSTIGMA_g4483.t1 [Chlamydomonas eustigma]|eukprot:GAX77036.1 hypothetical protein CEUSTIGMA_g4483.t1 [Chlamydomonas eustigma]
MSVKNKAEMQMMFLINVFLIQDLVCTQVHSERISVEDAGCCKPNEIQNSARLSPSTKFAFIIGAQKSGTTFLFDELVDRHPHIFPQANPRKMMNSKKEPHYFDHFLLSELSEYIGAFPDPYDVLQGSNVTWTFLDGTPSYLLFPSAACRVAAAFPHAKLVAVLRDPLQRAYSHWNMAKYFGQTAGFHTLVSHRQQPQRKEDKEDSIIRVIEDMSIAPADIKEGIDNNNHVRSSSNDSNKGGSMDNRTWLLEAASTRAVRSSPEDEAAASARNKTKSEMIDLILNHCVGMGDQALTLVRRGLYVYQLDWWLRLFPPSQLLIINHHEMYNESEALLDRVILFLGHDPSLKKRRDKTDVSQDMDDSMPARLRQLKRQDNNKVKQQAKSARAAFQKRNSSGWSLPRLETPDTYKDTMHQLYAYYQRHNERLYDLIDTLGPGTVGWSGNKFPSQYTAGNFE